MGKTNTTGIFGIIISGALVALLILSNARRPAEAPALGKTISNSQTL